MKNEPKFIFVVLFLLSTSLIANSLPKHPMCKDIGKFLKEYGCNENIPGHPVGGGKGYDRIITDGTFLVEDTEDFIDAIMKTESGDTIFIDQKAEIDLTGLTNLKIPKGIIIASNRGFNNSPGAIIFTKTLNTYPLFVVFNNTRITGLRLQGPDKKRRRLEILTALADGSYYSKPISCAIRTNGNFVEIDNCEISGWSYSGIYFSNGATAGWIHNCYLHHNQRTALGYGVNIDSAEVIIESCIFDWNRHCIAGWGTPGTSYEAYNNLIMGNANGHSFDMHGGKDRNDNTDIAGDIILIYNNTFLADSVYSVVIRGKPQIVCLVTNNIFPRQNKNFSIMQKNITGNVKINTNLYKQ